MIGLTRTTGERCILDAARIQRIELCPETNVVLTDGTRCVVIETLGQVIGRTRESRAAVRVSAWRLIDTPEETAELTGAAVVPSQRSRQP
jgi:uncharacterized protein YlzI (FlbEa/FlbD family)